MSLLDEARAEAPNRRGTCYTGEYLATLSEADRADYEAAVTDPSIPTSAIHRALSKRGMRGRYDVTRRHVLGQCACDA